MWYSVDVLVGTKPFIQEFSEFSKSAVEGEMVVFSVQVSGSPSPSISWYHDNTQVESDYAHDIADNGSLTIYTTEMKHAGIYRMVATNSAGTVDQQLKFTVLREAVQAAAVDLSPAPPVRPPKNAAPPSLPPKPTSLRVDQFGAFVAKNHADTNKGFRSLYQVSHSRLCKL